MTTALRTPEAPATSRQLWYLHILTKEDTRGLKLTMAEAAERIEKVKGNGKQPAAVQQDKRLASLDKRYQNLTGSGMDIGGIRIVQAFKDVAIHEKDSICIHVRATGIFPSGKKPHLMSKAWGYEDGSVVLRPLCAQIRNDVTVKGNEYQAWVKSLPVKFSTTSPIPEDWKARAEVIAKDIDSNIAIIKMV